MYNFPPSHKPYTDKYFLRTNEILKADNLNPIVLMQIFIRKGEVPVYGIDEAIESIKKYAESSNLKIWAVKEGSYIENCETIMLIEGHIQDFVELETFYLGVISRQTTLRNSEIKDVTETKILKNAYEIMSQIVETVQRPVIYMGARHWGWELDYDLSNMALKAGATSCSTDNGALSHDQLGVGTTPHVLENIYAWKYGKENAVVESIKAFDKHIDQSVPRIALIDYFNQEAIDMYNSAKVVALEGVRVDTSGSNTINLHIASNNLEKHLMELFEKYLPQWKNNPYIVGQGVSGFGVLGLKTISMMQELNLKFVLSSGFGKIEKVKTFVDFEKDLIECGFLEDTKLFDSLGVGEIFGIPNTRFATADVVKIEGQNISKIGRGYNPNITLEQVV